MKEINLRDFYPWYKEDVIIEVTEEVADIPYIKDMFQEKVYVSDDIDAAVGASSGRGADIHLVGCAGAEGI